MQATNHQVHKATMTLVYTKHSQADTKYGEKKDRESGEKMHMKRESSKPKRSFFILQATI